RGHARTTSIRRPGAARRPQMYLRPAILCPVDFSDASAGTLTCAAAIASHFGTRLIVLTVEDPLLTEAVDLGLGIIWSPDESTRELEAFVQNATADAAPHVTCEYEVAVG